MKKIVLASNNKHKLKEFKEILNDYEIISLNDIGFLDDIEENGKTFKDNALIKAECVRKFLNNRNLDYIVVAEDSGLCCEGLGGLPGIHSARYAKDHDDQANRDKLRKELKNKNRDAYFVCSIVVYYPDGVINNYEGKTYGKIIDEEIGSKEFGYDCIFLSNDLNKTFGEATEREKNGVSHRKRAIELMLKDL